MSELYGEFCGEKGVGGQLLWSLPLLYLWTLAVLNYAYTVHHILLSTIVYTQHGNNIKPHMKSCEVFNEDMPSDILQ